MQQISLEEAQAQFLRLLREVLNGEEIIITQDNKPIAKLIPISHAKRTAQFGSAEGLITMSDNFDEPLEDFKNH
jgi:prevent-host-death family protein